MGAVGPAAPTWIRSRRDCVGHLLVVESWIGASSVLLPRAIEELGHRFTFVTRSLDHYLSNSPVAGRHPLLAASAIVEVETNDLASLLPAVERAHARDPYDGVLTTCDYYLEHAAAVAARLGLPGPSVESVQTARRKHLMRHALDAAGLPGVRHRVASGPAEAVAAAGELGFPVVVKPVDLCAGMYVSCARDAGEVAAVLERLSGFPVNARKQPRPAEVLVEELLDGDEVSVETCSYAGETRVVGVTDKPLAGFPAFVEAGHMFPARLPAASDRAAGELAVAALAATGYGHGVAHVEIRLTTRGPRVVEINPRQGGNYITELIRLVAGIDLSHAMVQLALGTRPALEPASTGVRSAAIRFLLPTAEGDVVAVEGEETLERDPAVVAWRISAAPGDVLKPLRDNSAYLGHVIAVDRTGHHADALAAAAADRVRVRTTAAPSPVGA
jgi:biotin carboxylase